MHFDPSTDKIFIWGMPGSGKSTLGRRLAHQLICNFTDLDIYIENKSGQTIPQIFKQQGEKYFRQMEHEALQELIQTRAGIISTGGGTPCFYDHVDRMNQAGLTIFLDTPMSTIIKRVSKRSGRPLLDNKSNKESELFNLRSTRLRFYEQADIRIKEEPDDLLEQIDRFFS
jgi:shikimate kinase